MAGAVIGAVLSQSAYAAPIYSPPVVVTPRPVFVAPRPVYVAPRPVYVEPRPIYVAPRPVHVERPVYGAPHGGLRHDGVRDARWVRG